MKTLDVILAAVDFSPGSRAALDQAVRIAALQGAALHVLHVVDSHSVEALVYSRASDYERQAQISSEGADKALTQWLALTPLPPGLTCQIHIRIGVPLHEILEMVHTLGVKLLVAGIAGTGGASTGAGSVAGKLARKTPCRVLLVRANHAGAFKKIVACIDFSDCAKEVAASAHRVAVKDGASVDFLHVWQDPWMAMAYAVPFVDTAVPVFTPSTEQRADFVRYLREELHTFVGKETEGIKAAEVLREDSSYGTGIEAHALECAADLVIIGARGRSNLRYLLLGSTAEQLLKTAPCSLLVIKGPDQA